MAGCFFLVEPHAECHRILRKPDHLSNSPVSTGTLWHAALFALVTLRIQRIQGTSDQLASQHVYERLHPCFHREGILNLRAFQSKLQSLACCPQNLRMHVAN